MGGILCISQYHDYLNMPLLLQQMMTCYAVFVKYISTLQNSPWNVIAVWYYNMVGVVVAMVISTMHEKSCIDSHNARGIWKKFQNSVIHTSRNHSDEIAEVSQSWIS